jgi:hypothetical protein
MQAGTVYRLNTPTLGIPQGSAGNKCAPVRMPQGALVALIDGTSEGPFVRVLWDGMAVSIFVVDLKERGEIVEAARA